MAVRASSSTASASTGAARGPVSSNNSSSKATMSFPTAPSPGSSRGKKRARFADSSRTEDAAAAADSESTFDDADGVEDDDGVSGSHSGDSTDDEIDAAKRGAAAGAKAKGKTAKRKRRAVSPTAFGEALDAFLGDGRDSASQGPQASEPRQAESSSARAKLPSNAVPIFSRAPSVRSRISSTTLSAKAARVALEERRAREGRWRVKDVIGSWGRPGQRPGEAPDGDEEDEAEQEEIVAWQGQGGTKGYERRLRKVAQRGVVKLFNAIRAAQSTTKDDLEDEDGAASSQRKSGDRKPSQSATAASAAHDGGVSGRNALGGKSRELADLSKANFLDLIRTSGKGGNGAKGAMAATAAAAR